MTAHSSIFLPRESHGQRSLAGYSPWGRTESDTPEATWHIRMWSLSCDTRDLSVAVLGLLSSCARRAPEHQAP